MCNIEFDRAVVVVPLRVLATDDDSRYVSTDTIGNVLRTYRKLSPCGDGRLGAARALLSRVSRPVAITHGIYVGRHIYTAGMSLLDQIAAIRHPGDAIRERRIDLGWSQTELARRSGVTQADISKIENGHLDARWSTIQRLSTILAEEHAPIRSLANGARRTPPVVGRGGWRPSRPTIAVNFAPVTNRF